MTTPNMHDNVPGTEYLVDTNHNLNVSHASSGESDIVLLPQPTACGRDPLVSLEDIFRQRKSANDRTAMVDAKEVLAADSSRSLRLWVLVWREQLGCSAYRDQQRGKCAFDCFGWRWCAKLPSSRKRPVLRVSRNKQVHTDIDDHRALRTSSGFRLR
jgi:hypothetical protein